MTASEKGVTLHLRLLATSDLHAHLAAWDYYLDRPSEGTGLARVATLVRKARAEVANCLFFDNGDLIEGSPLAEHAFHLLDATQGAVHPMIAALNDLGCDAAALGNHEFSLGMGFLKASVGFADYPVLSANILAHKGAGPADDLPLFQPWVILERVFADTNGTARTLRIGVLGLTPPEVLDWDKSMLPANVQARAMLETAAYQLPLIRAAGADVVVVLAHTGIGTQSGLPVTENVGAQLAELPGVDALILGHEHQVFPRRPGIALGETAGDGALHEVAAVMPGAFGSHLGVIDLDLAQDGAGWRVKAARVECRPIATRGEYGQVLALVADDPALAMAAEASHQAARAWMAQRVGESAVPLHSYFAIAQPNAMQTLIAQAQAAYLAELLAGTEWDGLPVLSAASPFKTGGRGGPEYFTNVPTGPLLMRNAADLYVHPNRFAALVMTGADLRDWLERAASTYARIVPGVQDQPLLHPQFPATCLEMIAGLTYQIDLAAPSRHATPTSPANGQPGRIRHLCYDGAPIDDRARFALATNSHRLGVMLGIMPQAQVAVIVDGSGQPSSRDVVLRHLARAMSAPGADATPSLRLNWSFSPLKGTSVTLDTSPAAVRHVADIAHMAPTSLGLTAEGFLRFRLHL